MAIDEHAVGPQPGEHERRLIDELQWTKVGPAAIAGWLFEHRPRDSGPYAIIDLHVGGRKVQVVVSPTGRSTRIYVDGVEAVKP